MIQNYLSYARAESIVQNCHIEKWNKENDITMIRKSDKAMAFENMIIVLITFIGIEFDVFRSSFFKSSLAFPIT